MSWLVPILVALALPAGAAGASPPERVDLGPGPVTFDRLAVLLGEVRTGSAHVRANLRALTDDELRRLAGLDKSGEVGFEPATEVDKGLLERLERSGFLGKVVSLRVTCGAPCVALLAASEQVAGLRSLEVYGRDARRPSCAPMDPSTAEALAGARTLTGLEALSVSAKGSAMRALARARLLSSVERLRVCTDDDGVRKLARSRRLRGVRRLTIAVDKGPLSAPAVRGLVRARALRRKLRSLRFEVGEEKDERPLDADGFLALARHCRLFGLRDLSVRGNVVAQPAVMALARAPWLRRLERLDLCRTAFGARVAQALVSRSPTPRLGWLCVSDGINSPEQPDQKASLARVQGRYGEALANVREEMK